MGFRDLGKFRDRRYFLLALLLGGCGGSKPAAQPRDETLKRDLSAGNLTYSLDRPEEAVAQYKAALTRAQARDDIERSAISASILRWRSCRLTIPAMRSRSRARGRSFCAAVVALCVAMLDRRRASS